MLYTMSQKSYYSRWERKSHFVQSRQMFKVRNLWISLSWLC